MTKYEPSENRALGAVSEGHSAVLGELLGFSVPWCLAHGCPVSIWVCVWSSKQPMLRARIPVLLAIRMHTVALCCSHLLHLELSQEVIHAVV